jgi:hypothetical protein
MVIESPTGSEPEKASNSLGFTIRGQRVKFVIADPDTDTNSDSQREHSGPQRLIFHKPAAEARRSPLLLAILPNALRITDG